MKPFKIKKGEKIVVIGGGFGGLKFIRDIQKLDVEILLVDKQNHHQFQPLFYQVASGRLEPASISFPFRKVFQKKKNVDFLLGEVYEILPQEKKLLTTNGDVYYDHLVIASGCYTNYFGNKEIEKYSLSMKTTHEAIGIRNQLLLGFERMNRVTPEEREALSNIVIVGAGATGVELAGAFAELKSNILPKDYPHLNISHLNIILLEGSAHTLNNMSNPSRKKSEEYLRKMGVDIRLNVFVTSYDGNTVTLNNGEIILSNSVIWAAGVSGNIIKGLAENTLLRGRYKVNRYSQLIDSDNIYVIGDIAYMETPKYTKGHPQVANVAITQGENLAKNIKKSLQGKKLTEFEYNDKGSMATIGKHKAVVDLPYLKFQGIFAWLIWMFLHLMLILSVRNKLIIFINWAWSYITKDTSLRLIIQDDKKK